ncbi:MAG: MerR family transcriptional regulator [Desulfarculus sp.]|nr:MAG: MerR family transcriptional regulator [Desulfarculus sp.]
MKPERTWSIGQLAQETGVSTRSIRFYEEKGLLSPQRSNGGQRQYRKRDRTRLKLILRGKRFGLSLEQCADILGLAALEPDEAAQIKKALAYGQDVLADLERRLEDLRAMRREIKGIEKKMHARLAQLQAGRHGAR